MRAVSTIKGFAHPGGSASVPRAEDLAAMSADVYWQQDEAYRYTVVAGRGLVEAGQLLGKTPWDSGAVPVQDGGSWEAHRKLLETRAPFSDFVFKLANARGELRYLSASGRPLHDADGSFQGYCGTAKDITRSVQMDLRLALEHAVTRLLEQSASIEEAAPRIIRAICEQLGWACGGRWQPEGSENLIRCAETWGVASADIDAFLETTRRLPPVAGSGGLNRRAWTERKPTWILDVTREPSFRRAPQARKAGLRSAFAFPLQVGPQVIGVMEFFSQEMHQPDAELLDCMSYVGSHIGQFIQRTRAEEERRRFRTAMDVSADLVFLIDPVTQRYIDVNETACRVLGYSREELLGMVVADVFSATSEDLAGIYSRLIAGERGAGTTEGWYRRKDGSRLMVESFRRAVPSGKGHIIVAVARDTGERKRGEQLLRLEHNVTQYLASADTVSAGLEAVIRHLCEAEGWAGGRYWHADAEAGLLRFGAAWAPAGSAMDKYNIDSRAKVFGPGAGFAGRVWQSGEPLWIADAQKDGRALRTDAEAELQNRSSFLFPVAIEGKTIGVLAFNSFEVRQPDPRLLQAVRVIGSQIGQFVQRKQGEMAVRRSEERFRSLTELSSDFYWESDAEHRLAPTQQSSRNRPVVPGVNRFGRTRWQLASTRPDAAGWAAHRACMEQHQPFRDFEFARLDEDGVERHLSISGEPMFDAEGRFSGYRGVGKDITARKRAEVLLELEHTVTRCLAEAEDGSQALRSVMRAMCEANGWDCGRYFRKGEDNVLRFAESWHLPGAEMERFIRYSAERSFPIGVGIVGRAGAGEPQWVADVGKDPRVVHAMMANEHSMRGAFMFAVMAQGSALGVLSFTSREIREPDQRLLQAVRMIGSQIGQFLKRKEAEEVTRQSEERFRALTELSSDWYWEQDENFRFTRMGNAAAAASAGGPRSGVGQTRWDVPALNMTEADWAAHRAVLEAHQPFRDLELHRLTADGKLKYTSISGAPVFDAAGSFKGYRGVGKDITARKRAEQLQRLEHTVTRSLAEADDSPAALKAAIRAVCETEGWECGRYFRPDAKANVLRLEVAWGVEHEAVQRYIEGSRDITYAPGVGLAGRVWQSGQPVWVSDLHADGRVAQAALAQQSGMHGAFVFPVASEGKTIGVLAFNSRDVRQPEERLLQTIHIVGAQIGQFVQRKNAEEVTRESEERFRSLTLLSSDMYWEQDEELRFTKFSGTGSTRVNSNNLPYIGKKRWEQNYVNMNAEDWERHIELLEARQPFKDLELCRLDESGKKVWISISGEPVLDAAGRFKGYRGVGKDITARKVDEEHIQYLANHDTLTALPNRSMFSEIVNLAIHSARRYHRAFAVLFVDLDRFKIINDTLGHEAGDDLLKEMAHRLKTTVRASDVVARLGGDEFVVLVQEVAEAKDVEIVARKLLAALMRPVLIDRQEYRVTASIGIAMFPSDGADEQALMKNADIAMYAAKEEGKNTHKFYSAEANVHSFERLALESGLRRGLEHNEFQLHYQPKVDLHTGRITGMEALVRWQHPELGMVPPGQFIPLAEESGLIVPLGRWVLKHACAQNVAWQRAGLPPLCISVNLSARQFADEDLLADIAGALEESGLRPEFLELELTESMVMRNPERALAVLEAVKRMGVRLAIDDFGVGYSSLTHLKRFPIDTLKVDRSFIRDIPQDPEDKAIAEAIIAMGKSLNLTVVAEGVETAEQHGFLREHACDEMQGYYFSKPVPGERFAELLRQSVESEQSEKDAELPKP